MAYSAQAADPQGSVLTAEGQLSPAAIAALSALRVGATICDGQGRVIYANHVGLQILGLQSEDLLGRNTPRHVWRTPNGRVMQTEEHAVLRVIATGERVESLVMWTERALDGKPLWIDVRAVPERDSAGAITCVIVTFIEITALQLSVQEYRRQHELLTQVMSNSVAGICVLEPDGSISYANRAAEQILELQRDPESGAFHPEDWRWSELDGTPCPHEQLAYVRVLRSKAPVLDIRHAVEWPNGRRKVLSINGSPILDERGEVRQLVFALVDLTEQTREARAREQMRNQVEQLTRLESLSVLAGGVAHDFNNLLVGVLGGAELALLTMTPGTPEHLHVERIIESANRAAELTRQLLAYSGKGRFEVGALDLSVVVEGTRKLLGSLVRKDVALALHLDRRLPAVEADPTQLRQILMNLVLNGTQAIAEGSRGAIDVRTGVIDADEEYLRKTVPLAAQPKPGTYAFVEVSDNGCGLDPALIGRIFEPFYSTKPGGHGLGLAAVLGIAQGHRGFVEVRSTLGQGTTIRLGLPARPDLRALQTSAPAGAVIEPSIKYTVLLVDDEAMVRTVTNTILQRAGASTIVAEDGAAALKIAADPALRIDFAVIDMSMPGMRGDQLLLELRKQRPQLPAVLMSGYSGDQGGRSEPNTRFLSKPFRRQELLDCLEAMLNLKV